MGWILGVVFKLVTLPFLAIQIAWYRLTKKRGTP